MLDGSQSSPYIAHAFLALFGAVVHALDAHRRGASKSFLDFLSLIVVSSFTGVMFMVLGFQFFPDQLYFIAALSGTGGYLGIEGMSLVVEFIRKRFK